VSIGPNAERPASGGMPVIWLWAIIIGAILLLLSWFVWFPWG
jgi:hypothetical protein